MEPTRGTTIYQLPIDSIQQIFARLSVREICACRAVCKLFRQTLTCPFFLQRVVQRTAVSWFVVHPSHCRKSRRASPDSLLHVYDADGDDWLRFPLDFLPFNSAIPVAASSGLLYLWCESDSGRSLVICNPITRKYRVLPQLGSAWFRHGTVLSAGLRVLVLNEFVALYLADGNLWLNFSAGLSSKPRSPVLVGSAVYALCDIGSPWRAQWKLVFCKLDELGRGRAWDRLERREWGEIFDILRRPRLIQGKGKSLLMVGGLKASFATNSICSTIIILRLDLANLEWDEAGRMPGEFFDCFRSWGKFKVFGMGDRVFFSGRERGNWRCGILRRRARELGDGLQESLRAKMVSAGASHLTLESTQFHEKQNLPKASISMISLWLLEVLHSSCCSLFQLPRCKYMSYFVTVIIFIF